MNLNFNFNGKTLLRNWWKIVEENFRTIQTAINDHLNKFTEHKTAAELDHPNKSVKQKHIADKAVGQGQIADYAVGQTQLAQYSVSSAKIYPEAVQTSHIKDGNVTMPKLSQDLQDLVEELQNYSQTINLTFRDFDKDDNVEFYCGRNSRRFEQDGWVYWQSGTDEVVRSGPYNTESFQVTYYFAGLGSVSQKADAQKPIERLTIKADFGMTSGIVESDGINDIKLYRVTDNMSPIDREFGEVIPASEYQVIKKFGDYLEVVFFKTITLQELSVAVDIGVEMFVNDVDNNGNDIPIEAYPGVAFKAEIKNDNPLDTELSDTSANGVENRVITKGIKAVAEEIKVGLYGDTAKYTIMAPKKIPELDDDNNIIIDTSKIKLFDEDRDISGSWEYPEYKFNIDTISNNYIYMKYDAEFGTIMLSNQDEKLPEGEYDNGDFVILLYLYGSKSEAIFTFERLYGSENADSTGKTYTVKIGTAEQKNISDLDSHISFLEAVNENTVQIAALKQETLDKIDEIPKRRASTIIIGTSTAGYTASDVDYLCDGTDDQEEINQAIASLPVTGGKILLLNGIYNITAKIAINKANITIEGMGSGTKLRHRLVNENYPLIELQRGNYCKITNLYIQGFGASISDDESDNDLISVKNSSYITISDLTVLSSKNAAINIISSGNISIHNNIIRQAKQNGIIIEGGSEIIIENNTIRDIKTEADIDIISGDNIIVSNNLCLNNYVGNHSIHVQFDTINILVTGNILTYGATIDESAGVKCEGNIESP